MARLLGLALIFALVIGAFAIRQQSVGCKGKLLCGTKPASGVRVALWDEDDGPDPDDKLAEGHTDSQGMFELKGSTHELTPIDPVCKVYHDCDDGIKPGKRKIKFKIPNSYITDGNSNPAKIYDIGTINLETKYPGEERDLF
ncbi:Transthyretin-like family protein [Aphelenchoides bicaudatus]|nr:Transthyretin-like family protein [Aphelenchoides bicaudatus]